MKVGYWARKLFERLSDRQIDRIFDIVKAKGIDRAMLEASDLSFDWHGTAVLRLLRHRMIAKAINLMRIPAQAGKY